MIKAHDHVKSHPEIVVNGFRVLEFIIASTVSIIIIVAYVYGYCVI